MSKFKEIYNNRRNYNGEIDTCIVGTATAFFVTLLQLYTSTKTIWIWFRGLVTDGYFMIFFSPFILTYWIILGILYLPILIILCLLIGASIPWMYIIELPASVMNKDKLHIPAINFISEHKTFFIILLIITLICTAVGAFSDSKAPFDRTTINFAGLTIGFGIGLVIGSLFGAIAESTPA